MHCESLKNMAAEHRSVFFGGGLHSFCLYSHTLLLSFLATLTPIIQKADQRKVFVLCLHCLLSQYDQINIKMVSNQHWLNKILFVWI